ncbi:MAG TPA: CotH kinase family protein [Solirubrobacterales bacterium]|nr:CotH kinase family protein [Solirubrobacterales bacterium]
MIRRGITALALAASLASAFVVASAARAESPADWLYAPTTFTEINLTLPPASVATLEAEPEDHYVPGSFSLAETDGTPGTAGSFSTPIEVGIRLKGSSGSFRTLGEKAAFKIKFDEFVDGQTFYGLEKMTLNNMVQDPSMVHEVTAYEAFRALGVPAPRTGYTYVRVNGESFGLHLDVESLDKIALEKQLGPFLSPPQHLYEGESGADVTPAKSGLLEVDEGKKKEKGDLAALVNAVAATTPGFSERVEGLADLEEMTRMWAVEKYVGHWDGYSGFTIPGGELPNNYYLYSDATGAFQMLPWGTDQTWADHLPFEGDGGVLFDECKAETGAGGCQELYRAALGQALADLVDLDPDRISGCASEALRPWQQYEQAQSKPARLVFSQDEIEDGVWATHEFILKRPAELATFLGTSVPATPLDRPCPPLRRAVFRAQAGAVQQPSTPATSPARVVLGRVDGHRRLLTARVAVSGPGEVEVRGMIGKAGDGVRALNAVTGCKGGKEAAGAGVVTLACRYTRSMRRQLAAGSLRVELGIGFSTQGGVDFDRRAVKLPAQPPAAHRQP